MVNSLKLVHPVTEQNFNERGYLAANFDVAEAVRAGDFRSGRQHFDKWGQREGRLVRIVPDEMTDWKRRKLERIEPLLRADMPRTVAKGHFDFLSEELRASSNIVDTNAVSGNDYDGKVSSLVERHADGLVLDCGAGQRYTYYENVVNFEIVDFDTTDVRGVGERLPFADHSFDAVISMAVLEHVHNPFACAREICRVLKPGGELVCCVPFLSPYHGYPHHYYNMTHQGLRALFEGELRVDDVEVLDSVGPIWALTWILRSWSAGLSPATKADFLGMTVADLIQPAQSFIGRPFVQELDMAKRLELACAFVLSATKPGVV